MRLEEDEKRKELRSKPWGMGNVEEEAAGHWQRRLQIPCVTMKHGVEKSGETAVLRSQTWNTATQQAVEVISKCYKKRSFEQF